MAMTGVRAANLMLRFVLELCALAALAYWGIRTGTSGLAKVALGVGAPLLAAIAWGLFVAPRARVRVSEPVRLAVELLVFAAAVAGLAATGRTALAVVMAVAVAVSSTLVRVGAPA
jgi:Protein of unknown function (DUF2568)